MQGPGHVDAAARDEKTAAPRLGWGTLFGAVALVLLFGPGLAIHGHLAADPAVLNDDARQQIWPLVRLVDPDLFARDFIAGYYLDCMPGGFRLLYRMLGRAVDPRSASRVLPYALLGIVAVAAGLAALRLAGRFGLFIALASVLGSGVYLDRLTGGLPRAFGYPLAAILMLLLVAGRPIAFAAVAVVSVTFYPTVAVLGGGVLAAWMLLPRVFAPELAWPLWKRAGLVAASAALMAGLYAPLMRSCSAYGPTLSAPDASRFPELGARGRYLPEDRPPFGSPVPWFASALTAALATDSVLLPLGTIRWGEWLLLLIVAAGAAGALVAARSDATLRRLWLVLLIAFVAYVAAAALYPSLYIPTRYPTVIVPVLAPLIMVAGLRWLVDRSGIRGSSPATLALIGVAFVVSSLLAPSRAVAGAGWNVRIAREERGLHAFLRTLPADSLVAGWPGPREPIESVPYLTLRPVLLTWETHQTFHERYATEMRRRMNALIDLFIDGDGDAARRLSRDFGVTHLIVRKDRRWLAGLGYMEPFGSAIRSRARRATMEDLQAALRSERAVYQDSWWVVLEIEGDNRVGRR